MGNMLTADDIDLLINQSVASLPGEPSDPMRLQQESATEWLIDEVATALSMRQAPSLRRIERQIATELADEELPKWLTLSRIVLVVRDAMRHPAFQKAVDRLPAADRYRFYDEWADLAASLYHDYPDDQIAGKPAMAINLLAGQTKSLRKALANALSLELKGTQKRGWWGGLRAIALRSEPNRPRKPQSASADRGGKQRNARPEFDPEQGIKRPSGAPRLNAKRKRRSTNGKPQQPKVAMRQAQGQSAPVRKVQPRVEQQAAPAAQHQRPSMQRPAPQPQISKQPGAPQTAKPAPAPAINRAQAPVAMAPRVPVAQQMAKPPQKKLASRGMRDFEATIEARFEARGLAPIAITTAATAAIVMAENVRDGRAPEFYEVEYEVLARSGETVAPGAVRTWTLHAFMECMRDDWFRDLFHALPSQARAETVWVWAKAAAEWFDVPAKLREFWVRALSGGDPVLAAAASRAFAAKTPQLPTRPTAPPLLPTPPAAANYAVAPKAVSARVAQSPLPASAAQLIGQTIHKPAVAETATAVGYAAGYNDGHAAEMAAEDDYQVEVQSLGPAPQQQQPQQATYAPSPTTGMTAPRPANLMMGGIKRNGATPMAARQPMKPAIQPQANQAQAAQPHRPMAARPPVQSPVFDRQTPRPQQMAQPEPAMATAPAARPLSSPISRPLPKRQPVNKAGQGSMGMVPMGAADIYYGASSDDSPMVPRDLSQMETIGSGD